MENNQIIQRPKYKRADNPPPMRFQKRDADIIEAIHKYDGALARRQIKELFWPHKSIQSMESRLSKLFHNGYLNWPDEDQRKYRAIPEPLVWLGWRGILVIARNRGVEVRVPLTNNENQMRLLQKRLRSHGIRWQREPNWNQTHHDLAVVDFRLAVERSAQCLPTLHFDEWIPESSFRIDTDVIDFSYKGKKGKSISKRKGVCPDGFLVIIDGVKQKKQMLSKARFLLEIDMATHDNPSFGIEKAAAGASYIMSEQYKQRFGANAGRWLVVTTTPVRMKNIMAQTKKRVGRLSYLFYFSTLEKIYSNDVLVDPIWWQVDGDAPVSLPFAG